MLAPKAVRWLGLLALCAAYVQGGLTKLLDFHGALAEMRHFGLLPAMPFAIAVIVTELLASVLILSGRGRWFGAIWLAGFTLVSTFVANRFWEISVQPDRFMMTNAFFEHLGLCGAFVLVACYDLRQEARE